MEITFKDNNDLTARALQRMTEMEQQVKSLEEDAQQANEVVAGLTHAALALTQAVPTAQQPMAHMVQTLHAIKAIPDMPQAAQEQLEQLQSTMDVQLPPAPMGPPAPTTPGTYGPAPAAAASAGTRHDPYGAAALPPTTALVNARQDEQNDYT